MSCPVCAGSMADFAEGVVLGDIRVFYHTCITCGLVAAANPDWLDRAYTEEINSLDVGLLRRCGEMADATSLLLCAMGAGRNDPCLDWGGGRGVFTRLMRDRGYEFLHYDPMAQNAFAQGFSAGVSDQQYRLVTVIEVLEHLIDPVAELSPVADSSDLLVATTEPLPTPPPKPSEWWYYSPDTGQHITFYTHESLRQLGKRLRYDVVSGRFIQVFHRGRLPPLARAIVRSPRTGYALGSALAWFDHRHGKTESDTAALARRLRERPR